MLFRFASLGASIAMLLIAAGCAVTLPPLQQEQSTETANRVAEAIHPSSSPVRRATSSRRDQDRFQSRPLHDSPLGFGGVSGTSSSSARGIRVFYTTNRAITEDANGTRRYTDSPATTINTGFVDVKINSVPAMRKCEPKSVWAILATTPSKNIEIETIYDSDPEYYAELLNDHSRSNGHRALIYIHGYAADFASSAERAAQLKYDLCFGGPVIFFSWHSGGRKVSYFSDARSSEASYGDAKLAIEAILKVEGIREISIIAHSMGTRVATEAVRRLVTETSDTQIGKVKHLVLAAPDLDARLFAKDIAPSIRKRIKTITVYVAASDWALWASERLQSTSPLGLRGTKSELDYGVDIVDATGHKTDFWGHSYYADNKSVLSDIYHATIMDIPSSRRPTLLAVSSSSGRTWKIRN